MYSPKAPTVSPVQQPSPASPRKAKSKKSKGKSSTEWKISPSPCSQPLLTSHFKARAPFVDDEDNNDNSDNMSVASSVRDKIRLFERPPIHDNENNHEQDDDDDDDQGSVKSLVQNHIALFEKGHASSVPSTKQPRADVLDLEDLSVVSKQSSVYRNTIASRNTKQPQAMRPTRRSSLGPGLTLSPQRRHSFLGGRFVQPYQLDHDMDDKEEDHEEGRLLVWQQHHQQLDRRPPVASPVSPKGFWIVCDDDDKRQQEEQALDNFVSRHNNNNNNNVLDEDLSSLGTRDDGDEVSLHSMTEPEIVLGAKDFRQRKQAFERKHETKTKLGLAPKTKLRHGPQRATAVPRPSRRASTGALMSLQDHQQSLQGEQRKLPHWGIDVSMHSNAAGSVYTKQDKPNDNINDEDSVKSMADEIHVEWNGRSRPQDIMVIPDMGDNRNDYTGDIPTEKDLEYEKVLTDADKEATTRPNHRVLSRRFCRRASTGRVWMDESPILLEVSDTHATVACPNAKKEEKANDGRRCRRRHSSGTIKIITSNDPDQQQQRPEDFWQMYEPSTGTTPRESLEKPATRRLGVRFSQDVTVWVMPKEEFSPSPLRLANNWVRSTPPKDQTMVIPLRKTKEEELEEMQQQIQEENQVKYADDDDADSLEMDLGGRGRGRVDELQADHCTEQTRDRSVQQSFEFEFDGGAIKKENALGKDYSEQSSFHQSCRFDDMDCLSLDDSQVSLTNESIASDDSSISAYSQDLSESRGDFSESLLDPVENGVQSLLPGFDDSFASALGSAPVPVEDEKRVSKDKKKSKRSSKRRKKHSKTKKPKKGDDESLVDHIVDKIKQEYETDTKKKKSKKSSSKKSSKDKAEAELINAVLGKTKQDIEIIQKSKSPKKSANKTIVIQMAPVVPPASPKRTNTRRRCSIATANNVEMEVWNVAQLFPLQNAGLPLTQDRCKATTAAESFERFRQSIFQQFEDSFSNLSQWEYRPSSQAETMPMIDKPITVSQHQEETVSNRPKRSKARRRASVAV